MSNNENPVPGTSGESAPLQSRSENSLIQHPTRHLPSFGQELKKRAGRVSSSHDLRSLSTDSSNSNTSETVEVQQIFADHRIELSNRPVPLPTQAQTLNQFNIGLPYCLNPSSILPNPPPIVNYTNSPHAHFMRMVSLLYVNYTSQDMEGLGRRPPLPPIHVQKLNGVVKKSGRSVQNHIAAPRTATFQQQQILNQHQAHNLQQSYNQQVQFYQQLSLHQQQQYNQQQQYHQQQLFNSQQRNTHLRSQFSAPSPGYNNYPQNSSLMHNQEITSQHYRTNVNHHPLLKRNISIENRLGALSLNHCSPSTRQPAEPSTYQTGSPQPSAKIKQSKNADKSKQKEIEDEKKYFEPYMAVADIEIGMKNNKILKGYLRINPNQFHHAYVSSMDRSEQDILIDGVRNRNRALEGDEVMVELLSDEEVKDENVDNAGREKQKKGKVVKIIEKVHTRKCIGNLKLMPDRNRQRALFIPRDNRIPRLNIPFTNWPNNFYKDAKKYENTLFLAKIYDWFDVRFALGSILSFLGQSGDMATETVAILAQNDLDVTPFGPDIRHLFPRLDYVITNEEIQSREDCRKLCIFSIDPFSCRDIDDAVSCRLLDNGNYEVGVHISDVSFFLHEDTVLDEKVAKKATTIYMVERAYHMLPEELCMLCSLFPGVDKLAFSVFWEITEDAEVLSHRFAKTVIHSCAQLAYDHAQAVLEGKEDAANQFPEFYNGFTFKDVSKTIKILGKMSQTLRKKRFDGGALRIDQPKVSFNLSTANGMPESFWIYDSKESHQLIEEFMLLANMTVANKIYNDQPSIAFLRCHPPPSMFMLRQLEKALKPIGIDLDISSAGSIQRSLSPYTGPDCADKGKAMVLSMLCAKPMTRAKYFCPAGCDEDFDHYALNVPLYTHFTSPIRRYADIMVHRLLAACLKYRNVPKWQVSKVKAIAAQCNKQKYNSKRASEMSTEMYLLKYIAMNSPITTEAVVVDIKEKYIDVIIVAMGLNRRIFFNNDFPGKFNCLKNEAGTKLSKMEVSWNATDNSPGIQQVIEVFGIVTVEMLKGDDLMKVETKLARPKTKMETKPKVLVTGETVSSIR